MPCAQKHNLLVWLCVKKIAKCRVDDVLYIDYTIYYRLYTKIKVLHMGEFCGGHVGGSGGGEEDKEKR